jgi:hypothetical protein
VFLAFLLMAAESLCAQVSDCIKNCTSANSDCAEIRKENPRLYGQCVQQCEAKCRPDNPPPVTLHPKYMVLGIIYAPPGCTASAAMPCNGSSFVDYASGSALGTKVAIKDSFKVGFSATVDSMQELASVGGSAGFTGTQADSDSAAITKTGSLELKAPGNGDGIDHGQDQVVLMLNPTVTLSQQNKNLYWHPGYDGPSMARYEVYISELRNPASMRPSVASVLKARGLTTSDYQTILNLSPFGGCVSSGRFGGIVTCVGGATEGSASPTPTLDSRRFRLTSWSLPYEPPLQSPNCNNGICNCPATTVTLKNEFVDESSQESDNEYTVSFNTSVGIPAVWDFKTTTTLTWTDSATNTSTTDSTQTATATIACPSINYTGPTMVQVYWDSTYGTFLFIPYDLSTVTMLQHGTVTDAAGKPVAGQQVDLTYGGKTFHTLTGRGGTYRFAAPRGQSVPAQSAKITVRNVAQTVTLQSAEATRIQLK